MDFNVERNLLAKFHKNERDIFAWNQNPRNSWLSQALIHKSYWKFARTHVTKVYYISFILVR